MPQTSQVEKHFTGSETIRDIVIGMSDGLTVPFALAAGLSGIANSTTIVITGGLVEIAAGSIAMGLGAILQPKAMASITLMSAKPNGAMWTSSLPRKERRCSSCYKTTVLKSSRLMWN